MRNIMRQRIKPRIESPWRAREDKINKINRLFLKLEHVPR
jgi:hypothetical protein